MRSRISLPEERSRLEEPIILANGLSLLHFWISPPPKATDSNIRVFGELLNTTGSEIDAPVIGFDLYDQEGNVLGSIAALPLFHVIPSDRPMPFSGDLYKPPFQVDEIATAEPRLCDDWGTTYNIDEYGYGFTGLEFEDVDISALTSDDIRIVGEVRNTTEIEAYPVRVQMAIYDDSGQYLGSLHDFVDAAVPTGKTGRFAIDEGFSWPSSPNEFVEGEEFKFELWAARDDQVWVYAY